jgi:hypothetical protein
VFHKLKQILIQLIKDFEDVALVNEQLEKMGHNIGQYINVHIMLLL